MKIVQRSHRRESAFAFVTLAVVLLSMAGCHSGNTASAEEDAKLRQNFAKKGSDIKDVPPDQRERVKALMQQNGQADPVSAK